ncbi:MAG: hypothetical protein ACOCQA_02435 [bacterium]
MKKLGIFILTAALIISINIFSFAEETSINDLKNWVTNIDNRLSAVEDKIEGNFEIPQAAKTYNISEQFVLSRYRLDFSSYSTTAYGEIKSLNNSFDIANFKLIIYGHSGEILDTSPISFMGLKAGQSKTFDIPLNNIKEKAQVDGFKIEFTNST